MNFLNLSFGQFAGFAAVISAGIIALYLLDRHKRRQVVATLRFWTASDIPQQMKRSRRIHQPWSLLLQLISILLLLLALAGPRLGGNANGPRDHVLILDTSAWMGARARQGILLDQAKTTALAYLATVSQDDRVMLVRADALATPVTAFESDKAKIERAIRQSQPGASALNLEQALEFAQRSQQLQSQRAGEIVFSGAGRISADEAAQIQTPRNLRALLVPAAGENVGIRKLGVRQSPTQPDSWEAFVAMRNDGLRPRDTQVELRLAGSIVGAKTLTLAPGAEADSTFTFRKQPAETLEARLRSPSGRGDSFPQDDLAAVDLPIDKKIRVLVYSDQPDLLKPLLATPQVEATYQKPSQYDAQAQTDILVFDRFAPPAPPAGVSSIWIEPPAQGSPFAVRSTETKVKLESWSSDSPLAAGLYTKDLELPSTQIFIAAKGDQAIAQTAKGPVVIARALPTRMVALGFQPERSAMKYALATPLLMANILRWMAPETFLHTDVQAGVIGSVSVALDKGTDPSTIRVVGENQRPLPFTIENDTLRFFSGAPGIVRLQTGNRETAYSLTLPDVADVVWKPEARIPRTLPGPSSRRSSAMSIWPWLALAGGLGLLLDWLYFGTTAVRRLRAAGSTGGVARKLTQKLAWKPTWRKAS